MRSDPSSRERSDHDGLRGPILDRDRSDVKCPQPTEARDPPLGQLLRADLGQVLLVVVEGDAHQRHHVQHAERGMAALTSPAGVIE